MPVVFAAITAVAGAIIIRAVPGMSRITAAAVYVPTFVITACVAASVHNITPAMLYALPTVFANMKIELYYAKKTAHTGMHGLFCSLLFLSLNAYGAIACVVKLFVSEIQCYIDCDLDKIEAIEEKCHVK